MSPIDQLTECIEALVRRLPAEDEKMAARWTEYPLTQYRERYSVGQIDLTLLPLVEAAIGQWIKIDQLILMEIECTSANFDKSFIAIRDALLRNDLKMLKRAQRHGMRLGNQVRSIAWVELFANHLPQALPLDRRTEICAIGRRAVGVCYLESLDGLVSTEFPAAWPHVFARLDALWQRAAELGDENAMLGHVLSTNEYEIVCKAAAGTHLDPLF